MGVYFMNEKESLIQAKENLKASWKVVRRNLKIYNKAVLARNKAVLKNVGNDIIGLFRRLSEKSNVSRLEKERDKLLKKQVEIEEQIRESNLRIQRQEESEKIRSENKHQKQQLKEEKKEQRHDRFLNFKAGVRQKASSFKSRFGKVKNSVLNGLSLTNINAKLRNAFDNVKIYGLKAANAFFKGANNIKDNVSNFTSDQIAKYYLYKNKKDEEREAVRRERDINRAERQEFINEMKRIRERTNEHRIGMIDAFAERDNIDDVQEEIAMDVEKIMEENKKNNITRSNLNLNPKKKQNIKSSYSRLGRVKNSVLFNLKLTNIDSKLRNAFDNLQLFGINVARGSVRGINNIRENLSDFTSEQIARYSAWRINKEVEKVKNFELRKSKEEEKARKSRLLEADRMIESSIKERTKDHKIGMLEALNEEERENYNTKHDEFLIQREKLLQSLTDEKNKLLGKQDVNKETLQKRR